METVGATQNIGSAQVSPIVIQPHCFLASQSSSAPPTGPMLEHDADGKLVLRSNVTVTKTASTLKGKSAAASEQSASTSAPAADGGGGETGLLTVLAEPRVSTDSPATNAVANPALLSDFATREQVLLRQMHLVQQPPFLQTTQAGGFAALGGAGAKPKTSKRRNSRELRELLELEKLTSTSRSGELDRFVICSDGPMNCALCGFNTNNYSSFKSHIICSHPCWRITKKLSRNRLLVEKSVKVSIPVANFSVPNPVPAVPIQSRVQSKKNKKEASSSASSAPSSTSSSTRDVTTGGRHRSRSTNGSRERRAARLDAKKSRSSERGERNRSMDRDLPSPGTMSDSGDAIISVTDSPPMTSRRHILLASDELARQRVFRCACCFRTFDAESDVVSHVNDLHPDVTFCASPTSSVSRSNSALDAVQVSNDGGLSFSRHKRLLRSASDSGASQQQAPLQQQQPQPVFRCQICGYFANSTEAVRDHAEKIHPRQGLIYEPMD